MKIRLKLTKFEMLLIKLMGLNKIYTFIRIKSSFIWILLIAVSASFIDLQAQNEYNIWELNNHTGIDFNPDKPIAIYGGKLGDVTSCTSICDSNGNLLFYSDGDTIYDRRHVIMKNGICTKNHARQLAFQGSMAVPVPGSTRFYYLFTNSSNNTPNQYDSLRYWIIDMEGNGGYGEVIEKEIAIGKTSPMKFALTIKSNKKDYWLVTMPWNQPVSQIDAFSSTNGVLSKTPVISTNNLSMNYAQAGLMKFSPDSKILLAHCRATFPALGEPKWYSAAYFYRFDNVTGKITQPLCIKYYVGGVEFSPDSKYVYIEQRVGAGVVEIAQYDLSVWDSATVAQSRIAIYKPKGNLAVSMQLQPMDGKIYVTNLSDSAIDVIHRPNRKGLNCGYSSKEIVIYNQPWGNNRPYFPTCLFKPRIDLGPDTVLCLNDTLHLKVRDRDDFDYLWSTGDTINTILVKKPGVYFLTVHWQGKDYSDTIKIGVGQKKRVYLGSDTVFCHKFKQVLDAGHPWAGYNWSTGDTVESITVNQKGVYSVTVRDSVNCATGDTIVIDTVPKAIVKLTEVLDSCNVQLQITNPQSKLAYSWSNGKSGLAVNVNSVGKIVTFSKGLFCTRNDTSFVTKLPGPEKAFPLDSVGLCSPPIQLKGPEFASVIWNTGQTSASIFVSDTGQYSYTAKQGNCFGSDTIKVVACQTPVFWIPNTFTPNGDNLNGNFHVFGNGITHVSLKIYNRWGEKIYDEEGKNIVWDGAYKGKICPEGVYSYVASITFDILGRKSFSNVSGNLTLMR